MNIVTKKAQTQATAPASIAVKIPQQDAAEDDRRCVIRPHGGIDGDADRIAQRHRFALRMAVAVSDERGRAASATKPSISPGTTPAMNRLMIEIVPPVASE